jgi:hypothetical protein
MTDQEYIGFTVDVLKSVRELIVYDTMKLDNKNYSSEVLKRVNIAVAIGSDKLADENLGRGIKTDRLIDRLAYETGMWCDGTPDNWDTETINNFAEEIVKEAYRVVTRNPNLGTSLAGKNMLRHFGVIE